jgi:hypothetical protein
MPAWFRILARLTIVPQLYAEMPRNSSIVYKAKFWPVADC